MKLARVFVALIIFSSIAVADLSEYPKPFAEGDEWTGLIVIGEKAAASDTVGAVDILASLSTIVEETGLKDEKGVSSNHNFEITDGFFLHLGAASAAQLTTLAGGTFENGLGSVVSSQKIDLPAATSSIVLAIDPNDDENIPRHYLKILQDSNAYAYRLSFNPALPTTHKTASSSDSTDYLKGLKDHSLTMLGKEYLVTNAEHTATNNIKLSLTHMIVNDTIAEGESKTYFVDGKTFEVTLDFITSTNARFVVNGKASRRLKDGQTDKLTDDLAITASDILYQGFAGGTHRATFILSTPELELKDTNTTSHGYDGTIKLAGKTFKYIGLNIKTANDTGTSDGDKVEITAIEFRYQPSDDLFIPVGAGLAESGEKLQEEPVIIGDYDLEFRGLTNNMNTKTIKFTPSDPYTYRVDFLNLPFQLYSVDILGCTTQACSEIKYGYLHDTTFRNFHINESEEIAEKETFLVTSGRASRILKFNGIGQTDKVIRLEDIGTRGQSYEVSYTDNSGELELSGKVHAISVSGDNITVDLNADGDFSDVNDKFYMTTSAYVLFGSTENAINLTSKNYEDSESVDTLQVGVSWDGANSELDINDSLSTGYLYGFDAGTLKVGDEKIEEGTTRYGIFTTWDYREDQSQLTWNYPLAQVFMDFWMTGTDILGTKTSESILSLLGEDVARLDSEIEDKEAHNLILVGGPCANELTAELMGNPDPCGKDFEENTALIRFYENAFGDEQSALVVAGHSAADTRKAASVLREYTSYALLGEELIVDGQLEKLPNSSAGQ